MNKLLPVLFLIFSLNNAYAARIAGADITYTIKTGNKVEVRLIRYRQLNDQDTNTVQIGMKLAGGLFYQKATRTYSGFHSALCDTFQSYSDTGYEVLRKEEFHSTFDFNNPQLDSLSKKHPVIYIFYRDSGRTKRVNTMNPDKAFYIEAMLDYSALKNNDLAPGFEAPPLFVAATNSSLNYNCGYSYTSALIDTLSFDLVYAQDSINHIMSYNNGLSDKIPMNPFCLPPGSVTCKPLPNAKPSRGLYFNPVDGNLIFTPTVSNQVGVIAYRINLVKYDSSGNPYRVGYITREMTLSTQTSNNYIPTIAGRNSYVVCEGNNLCFSIKPYEYGTYDSLTLEWNNSIPNAALKLVDSSVHIKEGTFCWQTKVGDARSAPYHFTAIIKDNACPFKGYLSNGYVIYVRKKTEKISTSYSFLPCKRLVFSSATGTNKVSRSVYNQYNQLIASSSKAIDTLTLSTSNVYFVVNTFSNNVNCPVTIADTIVNPMNQGIAISVKDTVICRNGNKLNLKNFNPYKDTAGYWTYDDGNTIIPPEFDLSLSTFPAKFTAVYNLKKSFDCIIVDTFHFTVNDTIRKTVADLRFCTKSAGIRLFSNGFTKRNNGSWSAPSPLTIDSAGVLTSLVAGSHILKYYYDSLACKNYEQVTINIDPAAKAAFIADKTTGIPPLMVSYTNNSTGSNLQYSWNFGDGFSSSNTSSAKNPTHIYDSVGQYTVKLVAISGTCRDTLVKKDYITAKKLNSVQVKSAQPLFEISPNPGKGFVNIRSTEDFKLTVSDILGKTIGQYNNISRIELPVGVYIFTFRFSNNVVTRKVIIQ